MCDGKGFVLQAVARATYAHSAHAMCKCKVFVHPLIQALFVLPCITFSFITYLQLLMQVLVHTVPR